MDFTLATYAKLLEALKHTSYRFCTFQNYLEQSVEGKWVILRHDVDLLPANSLHTAELESLLGIHGVYYFRAVPESWDKTMILKIAALGHEVGYHYESLTTCKGNIDSAYTDFCRNLNRLRNIVEVKTICMHGSPRSPYDSKDIWKKYSYRDLGIIGEPYFDVDFGSTFYLTDTGRRWDGYKVSVRDRIEGYQEQWIKEGLVFHSTSDIMRAINENRLPDRIMMTVHPQRWNPFGYKWTKELFLQNAKNIVKGLLLMSKTQF